MIQGIRINHPGDGQRIAALADFHFNPLADKPIMRVTSEGNPMGGVVISDWTGFGGSAMIHVAGFVPNWLNRNMLFAAFDYPFRQLGVKRLFGSVRASKPDVLAFDMKLGFVPRYRIEGVFPDGEDMILMEMTPECCRFLYLVPTMEPDDGKESA